MPLVPLSRVSPANQSPVVDNLTLLITGHIAVDFERASQLFLVQVLAGTLPKNEPVGSSNRYVVKVFDTRFATDEHDAWNEGPEVAWRRQFNREAECYRLLELLQGVHVPILHGQYTFLNAQKRSTPLLIMQYLPIPAIVNYALNRPSAENLSKLEVASFSALAALHSQNVSHNDIHCGNILWQLGRDKAWFVDFGSGLWPGQYPELNMAYKRSHDAACLRASLEDLGWIDPRPQRKPPFTGVEHCPRQCGCTSFSDDANDP